MEALVNFNTFVRITTTVFIIKYLHKHIDKRILLKFGSV
jgi:hypothetical protein